VSADRALGTILGGEPSPGEDEQMGVIEWRDWIMQPDQPLDYGECARRVARAILEFWMEDPQRATIPPENVYETHGIPLDELGITGFQWGWGVNAARRCVELPPVPNPAIVEIGDGDRTAS
jgi:hypothetical protein